MSESLSVASLYAVDFAREHLAGKSIAVLTGAGISTDSGIPDYRGAGKTPKHPMTFDSFMGSEQARIRYWARSFVGFSRIATAMPNAGHFAIAEAEQRGSVSVVVTQNVDRLHQLAGSKNVIDLHGRLDAVKCMSCSAVISRQDMDVLLRELNPDVQTDESFEFTPDGDAEVEASENFKVPNCVICGGIYKPDVVFFGEAVPAERAQLALNQVDQADALLVAGTSLQVNSGLRFVKAAKRANKDIVIVNVGPTKADEMALVKIEANTSLVLKELLA